MCALCVAVNIFPPLALAGDKLDIFSAAVAVESKSSAQRKKASSKALAAVYVKASGDLHVVERYPSLARHITNASAYVNSFQYYEANSGGQAPTEEAESANNESSPDQPITEHDAGLQILSVSRMLQVSFEPEAVQRSLHEAGAPLWQATRPSVLVWLVIEQGGQRQLVNQESDPDAYAQLLERAEQRGVPIVQPLLDLEEQLLVNADDVWGFAGNKIRAASKRYNADLILVGKLANTYSQQWLGQWLVIDSEPEKKQRFTGQTQHSFVQAGIDLVADDLAGRFSVAQYNASGKRGFELRVEAVNSAKDYLELNRHLNLVDGLENLRLVSIERNSCSFVFESTGEPENINALLTLGGKLRHRVVPSNLANQLSYHWQG